jgi:hypothetical protein
VRPFANGRGRVAAGSLRATVAVVTANGLEQRTAAPSLTLQLATEIDID